MKTIYNGSVVEVDGISFVVSIDDDPDSSYPWEEFDGHGPVSDWTPRSKRPGEMVLCESNGFRRYYDFQRAVKIARRNRWNTAPYSSRTPGEQAAAAALADYNYLRRWCDSKWEFVIVTVHPLDDFGDILPMSASLGGVEYDPDDTSYVGYIVEELTRQVISEHEYMFAAPLPKVEEVIDPDELLTLPDFSATLDRAA